MKVGIDARKIGPYVNYVLKSLPKHNRHQFVLFFDSRISSEQAKKYQAKNVRSKRFPFSQYRKYLRQAYSQILVSAFLAKERLDVFHATAGTMPLIYSGKSVLNIWQMERFKSKRSWQKKICRKAKLIIVNSKELKNSLIKKYQVPEGKIIVMKRPQANQIFNAYKKAKTSARESK